MKNQAYQAGLAEEELIAIIGEQCEIRKDPVNQWGLTLIAPSADISNLIQFLRDDDRLQMNVLLDITAIDLSEYPSWDGERFAVVYLLRSLIKKHMVTIKIFVDEDEPEVTTISNLYKIADWQEREVFDQYGIRFLGHPNLKRLLNHHEFEGHPLRKDYPAQKRQKLSVNDTLIDELSANLERDGYRVLEQPQVDTRGDGYGLEQQPQQGASV